MADDLEVALISNLARSVIERAAPRELPLFPATSKAYFRMQGKRRSMASKDEMLGFGDSQGDAFLTPIVLAISAEVVDFIVRNFPGVERSQALAAARGVIRPAWGPTGQPSAPVTPLNPAQAASLWQMINDRVRAYQLDGAYSQAVAYSLMTSVVTAG